MSRMYLAVLLAFFAGGCAHGGSAPDQHPVVLSLTGLDCADCFSSISDELEKMPGVGKVSFDKLRVEATVLAGREVDPAGLVAAVERAGYHATVGAGHGAYIDGGGFPDGADVLFTTRTGEDVPDLGAVVARGKLTVFDLYADWCGPCRKVDEHMREVLGRRKDVAYRKLNVVDWDSPLAKRYLSRVPDLPYVVVYGPDGRRLGEVSGLHIDRLDALLGGRR